MLKLGDNSRHVCSIRNGERIRQRSSQLPKNKHTGLNLKIIFFELRTEGSTATA